MAKQKAPAKLTGGAGFQVEDQVAARFLLDMLGATNALGTDFGMVAHVDWQARDAGWLADDLAIVCSGTSGDRCAGISVKSDRQVTRGGFPQDFVDIAWGQWLGDGTTRKLREGSDALVLVTGWMANDVEVAWSKTLSECLQTSPERMLARLSSPAIDAEGSQSSEIERSLFSSFHCPERLSGLQDTDKLATVRLLRHVRVLRFDFSEPTSRDHVRAIADCQQVLRSGDGNEASDLWECLINFASTKRPTGGSATLSDVLVHLRGRFSLRDHPDYRHDWEVLGRRTQDELSDVLTSIGNLPPLPRSSECKSVQERLVEHGCCLVVGESGSGKSALSKGIANDQYERTVWLTGEILDCDSLRDAEQRLELQHPLAEAIVSSAQASLVVFDGMERFSEQALRNTARLIREVRTKTSVGHVHLLMTAQVESTRRVITRLSEHQVPLDLLNVTPLGRPTEDDIKDLVAALPGLRWASLRSEIRRLLTNLKILDWVARFVQAGKTLGDGPLSLSALIDWLWERWVEDGQDDYSRSHLLMRMATLEAETLSAGVPRSRLEHAEQQPLRALVNSDLIRVRDERVRFSHDMIGDWARLRVLVGEASFDTHSGRDRGASPRWHRAVRLYAQRLLEEVPQGCDQWRGLVERMDDESEAGVVVRDLFLESIFLATNARRLFEQVWLALIANEGRLLNCLLDRFLFVATVPDPRISEMAEGPKRLHVLNTYFVSHSGHIGAPSSRLSMPTKVTLFRLRLFRRRACVVCGCE